MVTNTRKSSMFALYPAGILLLQFTLGVSGNAEQITSPDQKVQVSFMLQSGKPAYQITYLNKPITCESFMGLEPDLCEGFKQIGFKTESHDGNWVNNLGERKEVPDRFTEMTVSLRHASGTKLDLCFRAYNEGAAFCYRFPEQTQDVFHFTGEHTEFRFPPETFVYEEHGTEGEYQRVNVGGVQPWCERPLTIEYADGRYAALAEAACVDYPRMLLSPLAETPDALVSALGGQTANTDAFRQRHDPNITIKAGQSSPWRMFVVGQRPGDLIERNYLLLNLNPPSRIEDTSWIHPGKAMRDTTLTTANSKAIIDFAATAGLSYVHLDARWYGSEEADSGDATTARAPNLDIKEIIRYGKEKNVGLLVYVDRRQVEKQRDTIFPLYEQWGIKGVKLGFVSVGPQAESAWITETIRKAAEHHLMLNIHDGYRATGNNRTYPNLMTVEGIRGNEHMPTAEHNCTLPFTRYIGGIGDYTVCYYDKRIKTTHAHQLAMAVVSFSPLQWIFWYDKPAQYSGEPEIEFFRVVPTVWDETRVINGEIGKFATIARRSGSQWFIGTINSSEPRQLQIPLDFLNKGKKYSASIYADDEAAQTKTKVSVVTEEVDSRTVLDVPLIASGGQAVWIRPVQ